MLLRRRLVLGLLLLLRRLVLRLRRLAWRLVLLLLRRRLILRLSTVVALIGHHALGRIHLIRTRLRLLVRCHPQLPLLRVLETAAVFSGDHNDPESWWDWADKEKQKEVVARFKRKLAPGKTDRTDPLSILVVNNMLLTGFDAPVEQVLYLDRKIIAHDLLQAIARVNRTCGSKKRGYVVDYIGVGRHLNTALQDYDNEDTKGALTNITVELPKLLDRRARAVAVLGYSVMHAWRYMSPNWKNMLLESRG